MELEETGLYWNHTASKATIDVGSRERVAYHMGKRDHTDPKKIFGGCAPTFLCDQ